jgi:hypothetical protein
MGIGGKSLGRRSHHGLSLPGISLPSGENSGLVDGGDAVDETHATLLAGGRVIGVEEPESGSSEEEIEGDGGLDDDEELDILPASVPSTTALGSTTEYRRRKVVHRRNGARKKTWLTGSSRRSKVNAEVYDNDPVLALESMLGTFIQLMVPRTSFFNVSHDPSTGTFCAEVLPEAHLRSTFGAFLDLPFVDPRSVFHTDPGIMGALLGKGGEANSHYTNLASVLDAMGVSTFHGRVMTALTQQGTSNCGLTVGNFAKRAHGALLRASSRNRAFALKCSAQNNEGSDPTSDTSGTMLGRSARQPMVPMPPNYQVPTVKLHD